MNVEKTKIMLSGIILDLMKKSGNEPFGVCRTGIGSNTPVVAACAWYTRNAICEPDAWEWHILLMEKKIR